MNTTQFVNPFHATGCAECRDTSTLAVEFTLAFQPIVAGNIHVALRLGIGVIAESTDERDALIDLGVRYAGL